MKSEKSMIKSAKNKRIGKAAASALAILMLLTLVLAVFPFDAFASSDTTIDEDREQLLKLEAQRKAYQEKLYKYQQELNGLKNKEKTLLEQKVQLETEISLLDSSVETNEELTKQYKLQAEINEKALAELNRKMEDEMEIYGKVLCYYSDCGEASVFEILFSSESFSDFLTRLDYIGFILDYNNTIVKDIERTAADIEAAKAENQKLLENSLAAENELSRDKQTLKERTEELDALLKKIEGEKLGTSQELAQLKKEENKLMQSIKELQEQIDNKGSFTPGGSSYSWPFAPNATPNLVITSTFHWRINPITNRKEFHKGLDIKAPMGTPIRAVMDGTVIKSEYYGGYGNMITVYHGNGISTIYAHCQKRLVNVGAKVLQNQVIARVGSTGQSTGAHLHIGFLKDSVYLNPCDFLPDDMLRRVNLRGYNLHEEKSYRP